MNIWQTQTNPLYVEQQLALAATTVHPQPLYKTYNLSNFLSEVVRS